MLTLDESEYIEAVQDQLGYCSNCDRITRAEVLQWDEKVLCPRCGLKNVMGVELAFVKFFIKLGRYF